MNGGEQFDHEHADPATCATCIRRNRVEHAVEQERQRDTVLKSRDAHEHGPTKIVATRESWRPDDSRGARQIVGRARVTITPPGMSSLVREGVVVASLEQRTLGERWVEYFDPATGALVRAELTECT